jgi:transcriptional regulator with XRE-family HTH domain
MTGSKDTENQLFQIGQRIRAFRKEQNLTLKDLGTAVNLSAPYLSQMENGLVELNITNLQSISQALNIPLVSLFLDDDNLSVSVIRRAERRWFNLGDQVKESLLMKVKGNLEIFTLLIPPGADSGEPSSHEGEEFTYVLKGSVRIIFNDHQLYDLEEGDVIYYLSKIPHTWCNISEADCEILVVNTPATF